MKWHIKILYILAGLLLANGLFAQGHFSGALQANGNFFQRDTTIGAANTPQYDNLKTGGEAWLNLNYSISGYDFGLRFDMYENSNLPNPLDAYSGRGIGFWQIKKHVDKLGITVGHYYDQIGNGIIFRAYEERPLGIDNAQLGLRLTYDLNEDWQLKAFTGKQKNAFGSSDGFIAGVYAPLVSGFSVNGFKMVNEKLSFAPGIGMVNRVLDDVVVRNIGADISLNNFGDFFFQPKHNVYAFTAYNTLTAGDFTFSFEGAYKTPEAIISPTNIVVDTTGQVLGEYAVTDEPPITGEQVHGNYLVSYQRKPGSVLYASMGYSRKGFGVTVQAKRTENFPLRVNPTQTEIRGRMNFLPPMATQNTKRLTTRYNAATQDLGELGFQADVLFKISKKVSGQFNFSNISDLEGELLYREAHLLGKFKKRPWAVTGGLQYQQYNQGVFEGKPGVPLVEVIVPYTEIVYKIDRKKSIRTELQYLHTKQDYGKWAYALAEFSIAPKWSFSIEDMMTLDPKKYYEKSNLRVSDTSKPVHFYTLFISYTEKANKFSLAYVRQPDGINCTGGVCRYEPAFSGIKLAIKSSF